MFEWIAKGVVVTLGCLFALSDAQDGRATADKLKAAMENFLQVQVCGDANKTIINYSACTHATDRRLQVISDSRSFLKRHITSIVACTGVSYVGLLFAVKYAGRVLSDERSWANWYRGVSLNALLTASSRKLKNELALEIGYRYGSTPDPHALFVADVDAQMKCLKLFHKIGSWLCRLRINRLFAVSSAAVTDAYECLQRLAYLKSVVADMPNVCVTGPEDAQPNAPAA